MSEEGSAEALQEVMDGLRKWLQANPDSAKVFLEELIHGTLEPLSAEDFFGTEGWEHAVGVD